eukprot:GFYU01039365.1.p2 GENE.GFYU01039365.1~~GFYU01039365.1.p2  ORF type:complete len:108 (-),score=0.23 GFYU01039365.1:18-299(-)
MRLPSSVDNRLTFFHHFGIEEPVANIDGRRAKNSKREAMPVKAHIRHEKGQKPSGQPCYTDPEQIDTRDNHLSSKQQNANAPPKPMGIFNRPT